MARVLVGVVAVLVLVCAVQGREGKRVAESGVEAVGRLYDEQMREVRTLPQLYGFGGNFECGGGDYNIDGKRSFADRLVADKLNRPVKYKKNGKRLKHSIEWYDCCMLHDIEGYCGGTRLQFEESNRRLTECMIGKWREAQRITGRKLSWVGFKVKALAHIFKFGLGKVASRVWPIPSLAEKLPYVSEKRARTLVQWYHIRKRSCLCGGDLPTPLRLMGDQVNKCCPGPLRDPHSLRINDGKWQHWAGRAAFNTKRSC
eukprot:TRINITY_DN40740_c0_g1_i1.p1 TRINITY_DN40740_c0_g1~~TRINITY_DN40740_c0_g1_i1.p1  ORF type:complete len:258 (-),score=25.53 TRINITY_DN40740_c0_g1_i1:80-853(-)